MKYVYIFRAYSGKGERKLEKGWVIVSDIPVDWNLMNPPKGITTVTCDILFDTRFIKNADEVRNNDPWISGDQNLGKTDE